MAWIVSRCSPLYTKVSLVPVSLLHGREWYSRGHTEGPLSMTPPPFFCGACLPFSLEKGSSVLFPFVYPIVIDETRVEDIVCKHRRGTMFRNRPENVFYKKKNFLWNVLMVHVLFERLLTQRTTTTVPWYCSCGAMLTS